MASQGSQSLALGLALAAAPQLVDPTAHRIIKGFEAFAFQNLSQSFVDSFRHARSFVNKASIQLNQTRTRTNLVPGICCRKNAAYSNYWKSSLRQTKDRGNHLVRSISQRRAAESAVAAGVHLGGRRLQSL